MWRAVPEPGAFRINLSMLLVLSFAGLAIVSAGTLLAVGYGTLTDNTAEQLRQKSEFVTLAIVERVRAHLDPVPGLAAQLERLLSMRQSDGSEIVPLLSAILDAAPQVSTVALVEPDLRVYRRFRSARPSAPAVADWSDDAEFKAMIAAVQAAGRPQWGPMFYSEATGATYLNYLHPIPASKRTLIVGISIGALSRFLRRLEHDLSGHVFILQNRDRVLAHAVIKDGFEGLSDRRPLPVLARFPDPVLRGIWSEAHLPDLEKAFINDLRSRVVEVDGRVFVYLYREVLGYGAESWQVGTYFSLDQVAPQIARNRNVLLTGFIIIVLVGAVALLLARLISRPFTRLASSAAQIARWQLTPEPDLPSSRIQEIGEANGAFRAMVSALHSFERYVPQPLVRRFVAGERLQEIPVVSRPVTVMFTDIIGFTSMAETMPPPDVAEMLNRHFELVDGCIEAAGSTVDKYIGDAVMAFWGGVDSDAAQASHACRAALLVVEALRSDNRRRAEAGEPPIRMRIGIHTGSAVVGNIGAPARINYTVIGDSVNMASRLERLARTIGDESDDVVVVISGETAAKLDSGFRVRAIGRRVLEGRREETEVFVLLPEAEGAATSG